MSRAYPSGTLREQYLGRSYPVGVASPFAERSEGKEILTLITNSFVLVQDVKLSQSSARTSQNTDRH